MSGQEYIDLRNRQSTEVSRNIDLSHFRTDTSDVPQVEGSDDITSRHRCSARTSAATAKHVKRANLRFSGVRQHLDRSFQDAVWQNRNNLDGGAFYTFKLAVPGCGLASGDCGTDCFSDVPSELSARCRRR